MGGNRKQGFRRGNASGRNGSNKKPDWYCTGCLCNHGGRIFRTKALDGNDYCEQTYYNAIAKLPQHAPIDKQKLADQYRKGGQHV